MISIPQDFIVQKFYEYGYRVKHNKFNNTYACACPICKEGKSFKTKRRCFYIPSTGVIYCHNCGWSSGAYNWLKKVTGWTDSQLLKSIEQFEPVEIIEKHEVKKQSVPDLPSDSINLFDSTQIDFYKDNNIVKEVLQLIKKRKLDTAINKPKSLYVSLKDFSHKNRLIIPFYDENNKVVFYQSRTVLPDNNKPKYLSKLNSEKTLYGINNLDGNLNYVFVFEGPINAFFTKNGVAVAGIQKGNNLFTTKQQQQIDGVLKFYQRIWVLDSQWVDDTSLIKTEKLLQQGETVFIWPEQYGKVFKDFNDICMRYNLDSISPDFIIKNSYTDLTGLVKLSEIKRVRTPDISSRVMSLSNP